MTVRRVFMDANVIIEAFRISAWPELSKGCWLETVQECEKEALTGGTAKFGYIPVDASALRAGLRQSHLVGKKERDKLIGKHGACGGMDPGEKDLFAYLYSNHQPLPPLIVVSSSDKGVVVRAKDLGWLNSLVSLEELLLECGVSRPKMKLLESQHHAKFLGEVRTKVLLGVMP
jgi:hypothetical protein